MLLRLNGHGSYIICNNIVTECIPYNPNNEESNIITVVEGASTNVNIVCGLDRINNPPLYWIINQNMYDNSNLPYILKTTAYGILTLETVNRRMDGWEFQCVRVTSNKELICDPMAILRVLYGNYVIISPAWRFGIN